MKKTLTKVLFVLIILGIGYSYYRGRTDAFEDIILEKCWKNKQTLDIECITWMGR